VNRSELALRRVLARFGARVRAQIVQQGLDRRGIDPDEIEQEVRIRLWRTLERDPEADLPASYIQRVVLSVLVDAVRRAEVRAAEPLPDDEQAFDGQLASTGAAPQRNAIAAEAASCVLKAIATIPERRRRPLELYLQGFTVPEVAQLCELTFDAARKLVYRGLDAVKQQLRDAGVEVDDE